MIRYLIVFLLLFAGAAAGISLLPRPPKAVIARSPIAAELHTEAAPAVTSNVRVVYPAPGVDGSSSPPLSTNSPVGATPVATSAADASSAAIYPQAQRTSDTSVSADVGSNATAQAGAPGLNLNTASIDALNQIPGAGRIGRTIASHRPYRSVEDLLAKRVIKKSVYDRIKDQVAAE